MSNPRPTRVRHIVLWLTVAAYMITYMDRVVISSAVPTIMKEFGFSMSAMGGILAIFRWGYALFNIPGGWLGDRMGPRRALTLIVTWWSVFTSLTAASWNYVSMLVFRLLFGIGEAGAFPIATRSLSRWMLPTERGYAQGITHAGSRIGAACTPPLVVWFIATYGWRAPFFVFGAMGLLWAAVWYAYYRDTPEEHRGVNRAELELIQGATRTAGSKARQAVPWGAILRSRNLWTLSAMYFCYGYCLSVYLDWFPTYLMKARGFNLKEMGLYASLPLFAGTLGDFLGGWLSDRVGQATGDLRFARKVVAVTGFLLAAGFILPATLVENPHACVWLTCIAVFGLELTVGVSWAVPLDIGGDFAGTVSSVMNTCGNVGGAISPSILAYLVQAHGWRHPFIAASAMCALGAILFSRVDASKPIVRPAMR
ncbi:MAG: putative sulfoacetate transporter SauU [Bryobacteraceae bacterium]|nr:putative sulfoacetate transporter SauU [Bryobacteraceae bacterium]